MGYAGHHKEKYPTMLTDIEVKAAKGSTKPQKLFDSSGLFLLVTIAKDGLTRKKWRFRFKFHKKEKLLALGVYPAVSLAEARRRRDRARALLDEGIDVDLHRNLTHLQRIFASKTDPRRDTDLPRERGGGLRSDRRGVIECYSALAAA